MNNAKAKILFGAGLFLALGAGCAGGGGATTTKMSGEAGSGSAGKAEIPFSQVKEDLFGLQDFYTEVRFAGLTGACADQGLSSNVSFVHDNKLGYFIIKDNEGNFQDDLAIVDSRGYVSFEAKTANKTSMNCTVNVPAGQNTGDVSCTDLSDKPLCTGMYNITAVPR